MRCCNLFLATALLISVSAIAQTPSYKGVGRTPSADEIKQWDISIPPSGKGLPDGSGKPADGEQLYRTRCAGCHGADMEGGSNPRGPALRGGEGTLTSLRARRTIGSYWGFATTVYDFIFRAMPPGRPMSLTPDQVYALTAYILYRNNIIREDEEMNATSLPKIRMPNRDNFIPYDPVWDPKAVRPYGVYE